MLSLLALPHELAIVDLAGGQQHSPDFLDLNPWGQVPVLVDGGEVLNESTAILVYLAHRYAEPNTWLPNTALGAARVEQWLSVASGELLRGPVLARAAITLGKHHDVASAHSVAARLLERVEEHLQPRHWLASQRPTLADVAMYSYLAVAEEGGLELAAFPAIRAWLAAVEALPGFLAMPRTTAAAARPAS